MGLVAANAPPICMESPLYTLSPGSIVSARLDANGMRCEATVLFSNVSFLPLHVDFQGVSCLGFQLANFTLPAQVPNGEAFILWKCAGQSPMCNQAMISGGLEDSQNIVNDQFGTLECLIPIATQTTISTSIGSSTTATNSIVTTIFSTSNPISSGMSSSLITTPASSTASVTPASASSSTTSSGTSSGITSSGTTSSGTTSSSIASFVNSNSMVTLTTTMVAPCTSMVATSKAS
ncbi:hypothetical protein BDZ45DRAFT_754998 [Acephala macrosclerotiorum]|nr:hypothetical protein BDZ45DRAFT_754998 [Acephala macrosclerotiorum]